MGSLHHLLEKQIEDCLGGFDSVPEPWRRFLEAVNRTYVENAVRSQPTPGPERDERLLESEQRFRTMADCAPVLLWMAGTDALCDFFNQGWLRFTGRSLEVELGNGWAEGVHPEDFQHCMDVYLEAFTSRREFRMEYRLRRADGEYRWILDHGAPRYEPDGGFSGFIGSCIDITDLKDTHDALQSMNEELEKRVEERTEDLQASVAELEAFSYSVSHDLRAPLRAINGFAGLLVSQHGDDLTPEGKRLLGIVRSSTLNMGRMIDDLLALSRLGRHEIREVDIDMTELVQGIFDELQAANPNRKLMLTMGALPPVRGDVGLIRQAFVNLLSNATKFSRGKDVSKLEVDAQSSPHENTYSVRDNGVGFEMQYVDKLFGVFHRLHSEAEFEGTGVGLAIVKRVAQRHAGRVWAVGEPQGGAVFYFSIPKQSSRR